MRKFARMLLLACALALPAGAAAPASAGQVGHQVLRYPTLDWSYGYYTYLGEDEYMYPGDYMLAEFHPSFGDFLEVLFSSDGDLQVWAYNSSGLSCDPTVSCEGWRMLYHSDTHAGGYALNHGGNFQIHDSQNNITWSVGEAGSAHWLYAYQTQNPTSGVYPGCAAYLSWNSNTGC